MRISNKARERYMEICHKSASKCDTYAEIDYKIIRAVNLGEVVLRDNGEITYGYYRLRFVVKKGKVIDMYDSIIETDYKVSERVKDEYDRIHMKMVV